MVISSIFDPLLYIIRNLFYFLGFSASKITGAFMVSPTPIMKVNQFSLRIFRRKHPKTRVDCISRADLKHSDMEEIEKSNSIPEIERFTFYYTLYVA